MYSPYIMGRDPLLWDEPLSFNPDRWIKYVSR
jgi:cytochrome P450